MTFNSKSASQVRFLYITVDMTTVFINNSTLVLRNSTRLSSEKTLKEKVIDSFSERRFPF